MGSEWHSAEYRHTYPYHRSPQPRSWARRHWYTLTVIGLTLAVWGVLLYISTL